MEEAYEWQESVRQFLQTMPEDDVIEEGKDDAAADADMDKDGGKDDGVAVDRDGGAAAAGAGDDDTKDKEKVKVKRKRRRGANSFLLPPSPPPKQSPLAFLSGGGSSRSTVLDKLNDFLQTAAEMAIGLDEERLLMQEIVPRDWSLRAQRLLVSTPRLDAVEVCCCGVHV